VYFPTSAVIAFVAELESGHRAESGIVGLDGFVGLPLLWGVENSDQVGIVQIGGAALRMTATAFNQHLADERFRRPLSVYGAAFFDAVAFSGLCIKAHALEQRLAKWLLLSADRAGADELTLTQEFLASVLAVQRPSVTLAAQVLQRSQMITYRHGKIVIQDREMLEAVACECYSVVRGRLMPRRSMTMLAAEAAISA